MRLAGLRSPEAQARLARGALALWPIGSTEAHGPHLPLDTDVVIAEETCRRAVAPLAAATGLEVLILPALAFTLTDFAGPFAGTISVPRETTLAYVRDVARAVAGAGFRAVCLVNAHLEPAHRFMLRDAVRAASDGAPCPILLADPADRRFAGTLTEEFASGSCHAGQYETSLVLAADAARVDRTRAAALPALPLDLVAAIRGGARDFAAAGAVDAYCGRPAEASAAEGEASYARLAAIVVELVEEALGHAEEETT